MKSLVMALIASVTICGMVAASTGNLVVGIAIVGISVALIANNSN